MRKMIYLTDDLSKVSNTFFFHQHMLREGKSYVATSLVFSLDDLETAAESVNLGFFIRTFLQVLFYFSHEVINL